MFWANYSGGLKLNDSLIRFRQEQQFILAISFASRAYVLIRNGSDFFALDPYTKNVSDHYTCYKILGFIFKEG